MSYHGTSDGSSEASMHYGGDRSGGNARDRYIHGCDLPSAKNLKVKKSEIKKSMTQPKQGSAPLSMKTCVPI
jgi:hypothetical protein